MENLTSSPGWYCQPSMLTSATCQQLRLQQRSSVGKSPLSWLKQNNVTRLGELIGGDKEKLLTLSTPQLNDICVTLSVEVNESERDLPRKLRRLILQCLEGKDVTSLEDGGMSLILELNGKIDEIEDKNAENNGPQAKQTALQHRLLGEDGTTPNNPDEESEYTRAPNSTEPAHVPVRNSDAQVGVFPTRGSRIEII